MRPLDGQFEIAIEHRSRRNIAHREFVARDIILTRQMLIQQQEHRARARHHVADQLRIALEFRCAPQIDEHAHEGGLQGGGVPIHPLIGMRALAHIFRPISASKPAARRSERLRSVPFPSVAGFPNGARPASMR